MDTGRTLPRLEIPRGQPARLPGRVSKPPDYYLLLILGDGLFLLLALFLACCLRVLAGLVFPGLPPFCLEKDCVGLFGRVWLVLPILGSLAFHRAYDRRLPFWEETRELLSALFWGFVLVYATVFLRKIGAEVSRLTLGLWLLLSFILVPAGRYLLKNILFSFKRYTSAALIIGAGPTGQALARALREEKYLGYRVVGFLEDQPELYGRVFEGFKVFGPVRQLGKFVRLMGVESLFVAGPSFSPSRLAEIYALAQRMVREIFIIPEFYGLGILNAELSCLLSQRIFVIRIRNNLVLPLNRFLKRFTDLFLVTLSLPVVLPLMLVIAILIKLDSPGPVFFKHRRLGEGGRIFYLWKFRTMYVDADHLLEEHLREHPEALAEWHRYRKLRHDPRVTRVGRFLRRFSLDELPQVFNILKGEMSLVGPRPISPEEYHLYYREKAPFYFSVKPGLTGLWQVSGRNLLPFEERIRLDVWYVLNWSFWLDLVIIIRTVGAIFSQKGSF